MNFRNIYTNALGMIDIMEESQFSQSHHGRTTNELILQFQWNEPNNVETPWPFNNFHSIPKLREDLWFVFDINFQLSLAGPLTVGRSICGTVSVIEKLI